VIETHHRRDWYGHLLPTPQVAFLKENVGEAVIARGDHEAADPPDGTVGA